jgi:hypothetical protein
MMSTPEDILTRVAQSLDELSDDLRLPELRALSDEIGEALDILNPPESAVEPVASISISGGSLHSNTISGFYAPAARAMTSNWPTTKPTGV